jgi:hypothetical protein
MRVCVCVCVYVCVCFAIKSLFVVGQATPLGACNAVYFGTAVLMFRGNYVD